MSPAIAGSRQRKENHDRSQRADRHRHARSTPRASAAPAAAETRAILEPAAPDRRRDPGAGAAADRDRRRHRARVLQQGHHGQPSLGARHARRRHASAAPTSRSRPRPGQGDRLVGARSAVAGSVECTATSSRTASPRCAASTRSPDQGRQSVVLEARRLSRHAART